MTCASKHHNRCGRSRKERSSTGSGASDVARSHNEGSRWCDVLWCNSWISSSIERTLSSSLFYFTGVYFTSLSARGGHRAARLRTLRQELARGGAQLWLVQPSDSLAVRFRSSESTRRSLIRAYCESNCQSRRTPCRLCDRTGPSRGRFDMRTAPTARPENRICSQSFRMGDTSLRRLRIWWSGVRISSARQEGRCVRAHVPDDLRNNGRL